MKADPGGSGFYRIDEPVRAVCEAHPFVRAEVSTDLPVEAVRFRDGRVEVKEVRIDADVLVLQRPMTQTHSEVARVARDQGLRIVVDIDDDFHNVHPDNIAAESVNPHLRRWHNKLWLMRTIGFSHLVTVSTPALIKYPDHFQLPGAVIRNRVPARALKINPNPDAANTVGWTGTAETHPHDLGRARGALARTDAPFHVVGDRANVARSIGVSEDRVGLTPWTDTVEGYWQAVADNIGVGIAPLEPSKFNRAKSWLKPAEYCALGIPFIASPTPEYQALIAQTNAGLAASNESRWGAAVARVLSDRERMSIAGREWAAEHTLESHADEWFNAWTKAAGS